MDRTKLMGLLLGCLCLLSQDKLFAQQSYKNNKQVESNLKELVAQHKKNASLEQLTTTLGGNPVWVLTLSNGSPEENPAIGIVGGVTGDRLLGVELSLKIASDILTRKAELLDKTTFYIFPNMSPDATEQYFSKIKYERLGNAKKTDDDRDGLVNEDGFEDLNGDGLITQIRIEDPTGEYIPLEEDNRIMVKADLDKGQKGRYKVFTEGIDNDQDKQYNEDGEGGVNFNKNFTYNPPYFNPGAGEHPVSEKESRALLDFLYERWNVYALYTFGPANNLSSPMKYNGAAAKKRVISSILKEDESLNKLLSEKYNAITQTKDAPASITEGGGFFEWAYFHFGRLSLSTPAWWPPTIKGDSLKKAAKNKEANFLQWVEENGDDKVFVPWESISHPDFPNQKVEVGGITPFAKKNPPYALVDSIALKESDFIAALAGMQPQLGFENLKTESLGNQVTRITVTLHNSGVLPTHTEMGQKSRWLRKINVQLNLAKGQEVLSGKSRQVISHLPGDGSKELTWLVKGRGKITLTGGAPQAGSQTLSITL